MSAVDALNAFGADVHAALVSGNRTGNVVFSPAGIAVALAMTSGGARGNTLRAMDAVLHIDDPVGIHPEMRALSAALAERNRQVGEQRVELSIANSLWGQTGFDFEAAFLDLLRTEYGSTMQLVDYRRNAEAARRAINAWVARQTAERIAELIPEGTLDADSRLTVVNAVYLKASWMTVFSEQATGPAPFTTAGGRMVDVPTMHQTTELSYAAGDGWQAVELPYAFGQLAMTLAVPATEGTPLPAIGALAAALRRRKVALALPKFDIETNTSLKMLLSSLGMVVAFSADADFSGMATTEPLTIADVIHQANITVDEAGTEAAAATAVVMTRMSAMPDFEEPVVVNVDRPFVFWLRDVPTGAVVFSGRVADPSVKR